MLDLEILEFDIETSYTGRHQKSPMLSVSGHFASLNIGFCKAIDVEEFIKPTGCIFYQIAKSGEETYLIVANYQFANQSYKASINRSNNSYINGISLSAKDLLKKYGTTNKEDKNRYDLTPVPIKGDVLAFLMTKVFTDKITTIEH